MAKLLTYLWDPSAWHKRRQRKLQSLGKTECSLRVLTGSQAGLSNRWAHGIAIVHAGSLEFLPRLGGSRLPRRRQEWLRIPVIDASRAHERTATGREIWSVNASLRVVVLRTPDAELEWAVAPAQRDWAMARLSTSSAA